MKLVKATGKDFETVLNICQQVVNESFGKYYPVGAVDYFRYHHGKERVKQTLDAGETYLLHDDDERVIGTISVTENEIHRFFVLPEYQGKGFGTYMMDICEADILKKYDQVKLDSALSSFNLYLKRGYKMEGFVPYPQDNGDFLCFFSMTKGKI